MLIKYTIKIQSYYFHFIKLIIRKIKKFNLNNKISIVILPLKLRKITLLKSPHVYKKSREQFEVGLYNVLITLNNLKTVNIIKKQILNLNTGIKINNLPASLKITEYIKI